MRRSLMIISAGMICCFFTSFSGYGQLDAVHTTEGVEISESGKKILFYQQRAKSLDGKYSRAGYVHPLYTLNGSVLTEDFPADHPYHRGIFWTWHQIIVNDKSVADGWTCENISWIPGETKVKKNPKNITINTEMLWKAAINSGAPASIIKENTKITIYHSATHYRIIDFNIHLLPLMGTIKLGGSEDQKGYGGFSLRLNLPEDISFVSDGKIIAPKETPVNAAPWMDFKGSFDGEGNPVSGIVVFCKAKGSSDVLPWILRKEGSMQNAPYPGRVPVAIPQKGLTLVYRLVVHDNSLTEQDIKQLYMDYIK